MPWSDNCDCRAGYRCDLAEQVCVPGCTGDRECCEIWRDGEGGPADGIRQAGEVTRLPPDRCTNTCDPCLFACLNHGCPGGDCAIGDPCEYDVDCPPNGICFDEHTYCDPGEPSCWVPGGLCSQEHCDLGGLECPAGSGCLNLGPPDDPYYLCMQTCTAGTQPGDTGYPCRDVGALGPSEGDFACFPVSDPTTDWFDGTAASGVCNSGIYMSVPGNWAGGTTPIGNECVDFADCASPFGLGDCVRLGSGAGRPFCTVFSNEALARAGVCETDAELGVASGASLAGLCLETCDHPFVDLGATSTGCSVDWMACYLTAALPRGAYVHDGETGAPGLCFPACASDAECFGTWGSARMLCDEASGICS